MWGSSRRVAAPRPPPRARSTTVSSRLCMPPTARSIASATPSSSGRRQAGSRRKAAAAATSAAFTPFTADEIGKAFAPHPVTLLAGTASDPVLHGRLTGRREIWRWLIALVFALFFADFLLGTLKQAETGETGRQRGWREKLTDWLGRAVGSGGEMTAT